MSIIEAVWKPDEVETPKEEAAAVADDAAAVETESAAAEPTPAINGNGSATVGPAEVKNGAPKAADAAVALKA